MVLSSVADPDPFDMDTDPDPASHFDTDTDHVFQFDTDPDPTVWYGSESLPFQRGNVPKTVPSNGLISSPFLGKTFFLSKNHEGDTLNF